MWARKHGAIFDTTKSCWVVYSPKEIPVTKTIDFGDRLRLQPEKGSKWLGVTFDSQLNFKQHRHNVITRGSQRAGFLANLLNTQWGIAPKLMRTLLTTTVHTSTDYGAAAWLPMEVPEYFTNKLSVIDNTCARAALGALKSTPDVFLAHDLNLINPRIRLQTKILNFIAKTLTKPSHHPLRSFVDHARASKTQCHHNIFQRFFQSNLSTEFDEFARQKTIDPTIRLLKPNNLNTVVQRLEKLAIDGAKSLKPSPQHLLISTDGSRLPEKGTGAAAWCSNTDRAVVEYLGPARSHGIFEAEYHGLHLGLSLTLRHTTIKTRLATILLDNQGVVLDMKSQKTSLESLINKQRAHTILNYINRSYPWVRVVVRWCPGHTGIQGNKKVDKLAKKAAVRPSDEQEAKQTGLLAFLAAIKEWGKKANRNLS